MPKTARLRYLVNHNIQTRFIVNFVVSVMLVFIVVTAGFIGASWAMNNLGDGLTEEIFTLSTRVPTGEYLTDPLTGELVPKVEQKITVMWRWEIVAPAILINNLLILAVIIVGGILYTHRIAGPLFNINRSLNRALHGKLHHEIRLRRKDLLHETAQLINQVLHKAGMITPPPESTSENADHPAPRH